MRSAEQLIVDRRVHAAEIARFHSHVVRANSFGLRHLGRRDRRRWLRPVLPHPRGGGVVRSPALLRVGDRVRCGGRWGAWSQQGDNPVCVKVAAATDPHQPVVRARRATTWTAWRGCAVAAADMRCDASTVGACGANGRWPCVKRCAAAGTTLRCRRRCWVISPHCGEIRQCPLRFGEHVAGCGELGGVGRGVAAAS